MKRSVISVGSNIKAKENIRAAQEILGVELTLLKASAFIRTAPVPPAHGDNYLNGAFLIETILDIKGLREYLKGVEKRLGRVREADRYAPRTMDLDIIVYNGRIVDNDYYDYAFVKRAVDELLPGLADKTK